MLRVRFITTLEEVLIKRLKIMAIEKGVDVNDILEKLITEYLKNQK